MKEKYGIGDIIRKKDKQSGRPKAALPFWFLMVVLLTICLWSASIVATCIAALFALPVVISDKKIENR